MKGIYTDLDTLFDNRLSLLYLINNKLALSFKEDDKYLTRLKDNMGNMSYDIFYSFYRRRNKKLLELSIQTYILDKFIIPDCFEKISDTKNSNNGLINIYVNTYPYILNKEEKNNLSISLSKRIYGGEIEFIHKSPKELTPDWVYNNVSSMYMYEGIRWIQYHSTIGNLARSPIPSVMLMVPTIIETNQPDSLITKSYLLSIEENVKNFVMLTFADTYFFCAKNIKINNK